MVKEFVPEMRSDKKDAEIARLREVLEYIATGGESWRDVCDKARFALMTELNK